MPQRLSRQQLIDIVEKLIAGTASNAEEEARLIQQFEANVLYPDAAELIFFEKHEFKDAGELVDFALGQEKVRKLSREELIAVAKKLMTADISSEVESERLGRLFNANVPHPEGHGLIFHPKIRFKTAEELVDYALSYKGPKKKN